MQLRDYPAAIARRWWIIALAVLAAAASSFLVGKFQSPVYRSSITLVDTARLDWGTTMTVQVLLRQQEEELKTLSLASRVRERMGLDLPPEAIQGKIVTKSYADSISVRLDVEDSDPERARLIALGYGVVFPEQKAAQYAQAPDWERVRVAMLEEPRSGTLVRPNVRLTTAAGAILGLVFGLLLAAALEYLDDTLRSPEDVALQLDIPVLGAIPRIAR